MFNASISAGRNCFHTASGIGRTPACRTARRWLLILLCACSLGQAAAASAFAQVNLTLTDGKRLHVDAIGPTSNERVAALQVTRPGIQMTRWLPWERIASASFAGKTYTSAEFRKLMLSTGSRDVLSAPGTHVTPVAAQLPGNDPPPTPDPFNQNGSANPSELPTDAPNPARPVPHGPEFDPAVLPPCAPPPFAPLPFVRPPFDRGPDGLSGRGVVVGVRDDPLSAYPDLERQFFPNGIPLLERGYARDLFRAATTRNAFGLPPGSFFPASPPFAPAMPFGPNVPFAPPAAIIAPTPLVPPTPIIPPAAGAPGVSSSDRGAGQVSSIHAAAVPISANGKADWDSLLLSLSATDSAGRPVPVEDNGTVRVTLWGQKQRLVRSFGRNLIGDPGRIEQIAAWTRDLNAQDSEPGEGARFSLPLPSPLPDQDVNRFPAGELHVELTVPGEGTFQTITSPIPLKHLSPVRDRQLLETGSPFFQQESTTDSRQNGGTRYDFDPPSGPIGGILAVQP